MRNLLVFALGALSLALASPASAAFELKVAAPIVGIPGANDFDSQLGALGLFRYTSDGASLSLTAPATVKFRYIGSESGFTDTFSVGGVSVASETNAGFSLVRAYFASKFYGAGAITGNEWQFTSGGLGVNAGIGDAGFGFFIPRGLRNGDIYKTNKLYFGFDDQFGNSADDNHDDFIIEATAVPEPATWAMLIAGFGLVGVAARRQRVGTVNA